MKAGRKSIDKILRNVFGIAALRPGQQAVIDAVVGQHHTLAIMPTGAGKSLCYQVAALVMPGMTVVVSPLIALMRDQFEKLSALGLEAVQINSAIATADIHRAHWKIGRSSVEFVFTTPEQLASGALRDLLAKQSVGMFVVDEAHCISQWGHDFRPAYLEAIPTIRAHPEATLLALTATATPEVIDDLTEQLGVGPLRIINTSLYRPNLSYRVRPVADDADKQRQLIDILRSLQGSVIVYAATVRHVDTLADVCRQEGIDAVSYHGRMKASARSDAQDRFMGGATPRIIATNAFGMGIDKPDVRAVIHYDLPPSLEVYYQESGRAGRNGEAADCTLLYQRSDRQLQTFFMAGRYPGPDDFASVVTAMRAAGPGSVLSPGDLHKAIPALSATKIRVVLTVLKREELVRERRGARFAVLPRLFDAPLDQLARGYDERRDRDRTKLELMIMYAQTALCRPRQMLSALGEEVEWSRCGTCDNCRGDAVRAEAPAQGVR